MATFRGYDHPLLAPLGLQLATDDRYRLLAQPVALPKSRKKLLRLEVSWKPRNTNPVSVKKLRAKLKLKLKLIC